ncbi:LPO_1073/Vpar_1526 family protein [Stutzerimonas nitrititolerans]|uniref:LPO_1073/Vpar_1526 family protein n=1 Tax=Stutzerimonas nitrititolerans TaxID=2482751 RepID=UPI0028A2026A|nr:LPO_1073/Vpar_1526 family protein [Stutzerimonas nitrititolerans]
MSQKQNGGDGSTNVQAAGEVAVTNNYGLSYRDAKEIALDIFNDNFLKLKNEAATIAEERAKEITGNFFEKLFEKNPQSIEGFKEPSAQEALFNAQKEYAKSGDKNLESMLVNILVDRMGEKERCLRSIVLDEALTIAPKLTQNQLNLITLTFLIYRCGINISNLPSFYAWLRKFSQFVTTEEPKNSDFIHIEYLRCGFVRAGNYKEIINSYLQNYSGLFAKGFLEAEIDEDTLAACKLAKALTTNLRDSKKLQLHYLNLDELESIHSQIAIDNDSSGKIKSLYQLNTMTPEEAKQDILANCPEFEKALLLTENTQLRRMELTDTGIALAIANYSRQTGDKLDLSIWIKD